MVQLKKKTTKSVKKLQTKTVKTKSVIKSKKTVKKVQGLSPFRVSMTSKAKLKLPSPSISPKNIAKATVLSQKAFALGMKYKDLVPMAFTGLTLAKKGYDMFKYDTNVNKGLSDAKGTIVKYVPFSNLLLGEVFGNQYSKIKDLSTFPYGSIILAKDLKNGDNVIIKGVSLNVNQKVKKLFENEIKLLQKLNRINNKYNLEYITNKYSNNFLYIIYKSSYSTTLADNYLKLGFSAIRDRVIANLISGLKFFHDHRITVSSISLEDILVNPENGDIKFADFGLSCDQDCSSMYTGSQAYMSPQMILKYDLYLQYGVHSHLLSLKEAMEADVWALGIVIYMLIYRKHPIVGDPEIIRNISKLIKVLTDPVFVNSVKYNEHDPFTEMLKGMLTFDTAKRLSIRKVYQLLPENLKPVQEKNFFNLWGLLT